jgi:aryl-alcohol dehydrogenase-like predicted oxidoreductase
MADFLYTALGKYPTPVFRVGLSATYRCGRKTIYKALDEGFNYFFFFGIDTQMTAVLRDVLRRDRERMFVATGGYNCIWWAQNLHRVLEKRLRQLRTDYIDVFHFLGVRKKAEYTDRVRDEMEALRHDGRVRGISISTHDRTFAGEMAASGALDAMMIRYNAAHRGAEQDIFPFLAAHDPGVVSFTATRWTYLTRRPRRWPKQERIPSPGMAYRFVLSNPHVDVCMMAPSNLKQFTSNLEEIRQGPLCSEEMDFMRRYGDAVYAEQKWFM